MSHEPTAAGQSESLAASLRADLSESGFTFTGWIRWHGALRAELPVGVARLRLPTSTTRSPIRYSLAPIGDAAAITYGEPVSPEAREDALIRDRERIAEEK
ncbi:hypothetical protein J7E97_22435 [Streptomyces sp. ISL-66]|uniref:hypothetical protein n=1 Tax=Streptomyces sp. ISL-66 TaxID=2819186 RepID=UPI001BEB1EF4|nr:hypothetical protein [Streptomyces sp. ISL-66]MBT2470551.1 hypothetical protein [Streptomyces sp. ISL-66]